MCRAADLSKNLMFSDLSEISCFFRSVKKNSCFQICQKSQVSEPSEILCFRSVRDFMFQACWKSKVSAHWEQGTKPKQTMEFCSAGSDDDERPFSSSVAENFPKKCSSAAYWKLESRSKSRSENKSEWGNKGVALNILRNQGPIALACDVSCMLLDFKVYAPPFLDHYYARGTFFSHDICIKLLQPAKTEKREKNSHILLH